MARPDTFLCSRCPWSTPNMTEIGCPHCGSPISLVDQLEGPVQSTSKKTAKTYAWVKARSRSSMAVKPRGNRVWVFTDGASKGGYAAVLVTKTNLIECSRFMEPERLPMNNVTAEMMAVALGLRNCPLESEAWVVSDYLGTEGWLSENYKIKKADALLRLRLIVRIKRQQRVSMRFIHHGGHQSDPSDFTHLNNRADELCELEVQRSRV